MVHTLSISVGLLKALSNKASCFNGHVTSLNLLTRSSSSYSSSSDSDSVFCMVFYFICQVYCDAKCISDTNSLKPIGQYARIALQVINCLTQLFTSHWLHFSCWCIYWLKLCFISSIFITWLSFFTTRSSTIFISLTFKLSSLEKTVFRINGWNITTFFIAALL